MARIKDREKKDKAKREKIETNKEDAQDDDSNKGGECICRGSWMEKRAICSAECQIQNLKTEIWMTNKVKVDSQTNTPKNSTYK